MEAPVDESQLPQNVLKLHGLRIQKHMTQYAGKMLAAGAGPFAVIGGDARTGVPRRQLIDPKLLGAPSAAASSQSVIL
jgi:hypothetical protein